MSSARSTYRTVARGADEVDASEVEELHLEPLGFAGSNVVLYPTKYARHRETTREINRT